MTRETRLLLATIGLSTIVVLALGTLRFPDTPIVEPPPTPLERLAASATYEQLARSVDRVARSVTPDLLVVRVGEEPAVQPRRLSDLLREPMLDDARYYPALRLGENHALLATAPRRELRLRPSRPGAPPPEVIAVDPLRQLSVLSVQPAATGSVLPLTLRELVTPIYVVVAEGTAAGVTFRPVFVGSADRFSDPRWSQPLLAVSGISLTRPGALVFSLEGRFVGTALLHQSSLAIAAADDVLRAAEDLARGGTARLHDLGLGVQELTPQLAEALKTPQGVVVAEVASNGPAAGVVEPMDVITAVNSVLVRTPDQLLLQVAQTGLPIRLAIVRGGETSEIPVDSAAAANAAAKTPDVPTVEYRRGLGSIVRTVDPAHPAARAGLQIDDLIVRAGGIAAPTPAQVARQFAALGEEPETALLLVIRRDGRDRVVAVTRDAAKR